MDRHFLGWDAPLLPRAARWLVERERDGDQVDLGRWLVVVPGGRASRRLQECLLDTAGAGGLALDPPRIVTVGALPDELAPPEAPPAPDLVRQLAWAQALRSTDPGQLAALLPEPCRGWPAWMALARELDQLALELAGGGADMAAAAQATGRLLGNAGERERWELLAQLQRQVGQRLQDEGWSDPVAPRPAPGADAPAVLLLGVPELPAAQRRALAALPEVVALVGAPEDEADRFDEFGCVRPDAWADFHLDLPLDQLQLRDDPREQAFALLDELAAVGDTVDPAQLRVGNCDPELEPVLTEALVEAGARAHPGAGEPLRQTPPLQLMQAMLAWWQAGDFRRLMGLLRHPDLQRWWADHEGGSSATLLDRLDRYAQEHLPGEIATGHLPGPPEMAGPLRGVLDRLEALHGELQGEARPLPQWSRPLLGLFEALYGDRVVDRETPRGRRLWEVARRWSEACLELGRLDANSAPVLGGDEALGILLERLAQVRIPVLDPADSIELLGWLELALDDSPHLVLCGFQEGRVPEGRPGHAFLPDRLREALGLPSDRSRLARDLFLLAQLRHGRARLPILLARRGVGDEPQSPSRLLFHCEPEEALRRAAHLYRGPRHDRRPSPLAAGQEQSGFVRPAPPDHVALEKMSVTGFAAWLRDPYRFWLSRIERLDAREDDPAELDARRAGIVLHRVLERFGADATLRELPQVEPLLEGLRALFDDEARARFGARPLPTVRLQLEQLRRRLPGFAAWQATRRAQGWRIHAVEQRLERPLHALPEHGDGDTPDPLLLVGKIDRIDLHESSGQWAILDYKTGDRAADPNEAWNAKTGEWEDLQLPLYALHCPQPPGVSDDPQLGYLRLSADPTKPVAAWLEHDSEALEAAHRQAWEIVAAIRAGHFPPAEKPPRWTDEFSWICQDGQFVAAQEEDA